MSDLAKQLSLSSANIPFLESKTWIANDVNSNYWEVAKSSHSVVVNSNTPKSHLTTIIFKKEICSNGLLTDDLFSILLVDIKQCLINIIESNATEKPYRLQGICRNFIYLIIAVNEGRNKSGLPPILSLSQITEEDVLEYVKSYDIGAEVFFAVVGELASLKNKPNKVDWEGIKAKLSIKNKTFSIIKQRITNSKNPELYKSKKTEIKKFGDANTKRDINEMYLPNKKTVQNIVADINHLFTSSNGLISPISFSPYELIGGEEGLVCMFKSFQNEIKTSIIPLEVAFHLISTSLKFQTSYSNALLEYLKAIDLHYKDSTEHLAKSTLKKDCDRREELFHEVEMPKELLPLKIKILGLEKETKSQSYLSLTQAIYLYVASMYILLACISATRELSILLLRRSCFEKSPLDGLCDIVFKQVKSNTNNRLRTIHRPINERIYTLGLQFSEFSQYLENRFNIYHEDSESYLFTNFFTIKKIITSHFDCTDEELIANHLSDDTMQTLLDQFSDWAEVPLIDGKRWYVNEHQFRRLFAILYFNLTEEKGIEELSWFLGHESLDMTFHYAEQNPSSDWIDEAIISISKRAANLNQNLNVDEEIAKVVEVSKEKSLKLNLQLESVVYQAINDRIKRTGEDVHFERVDGNDIYFYFTKVK